MTSDDDTARKDRTESTAKSRPDQDVGHALRSAYVETVSEEVPAELLDLLGKLG